MKIFFKNVAKCGLAVCILLSAVSAANAQVVKGRVLDSASGDPLIGVTVLVDGTQNFAITDVNGNYTLKDVPVGKQKILFKMMGYASSVAELNVKSRSNSLNVTMSYQLAKQVVVKAKRINNTEAALLSKRKKAAVSQDAISSEQISKSPDSDAADAAKRVTGVTIFGGKFIYVRGLDERYSSILVNGATVPSPLPNKRIVPLDVFPTSIIDNLIVAKTHSPDMPADFGGGIITVNTKDFPEEETLKVGFSIGVNSRTTFKNFMTYDGGNFDYLGYDDGTYSLPDSIDNSSLALRPAGIEPGYTNEQLKDFRKEFSDVYELKNTTGLPSGKISFAYGNTYILDEIIGRKVGFLFSFSQKIGFKTIEGKYKQFASSVAEADYEYKESEMTTNTTAQLVTSYSFDKSSEMKLSSFYTHTSSKTAREKEGELGASAVGSSQILKMVYTDLIFSQLNGQHHITPIDSKLEWFGAFSWARRSQPDTRVNKRNQDGDIYITESLERFYNSFDEYSYEFAPNITIPFKQWSGLMAKTKWGGGYSHKYRENESRRFQYDINAADIPNIDNTGSYDTLYEGDYYFVKETTGTSSASGYDSYEASLDIVNGYGMIDIPLIPKLRLITGLRIEKWVQEIDSFSKFDKSDHIKSKIEDTEYVPSANIVYSIFDNTNIRAAYSRTINRPDFLEASKFRYYDDIQGVTIIGNPDLDKAAIHNADLRFEWFPSIGEIIALSVFYKHIESPIEASLIDVGGEQQHTFYNQKNAENYGIECELRKSLGIFSESLKSISLFGNFTYIYSKIKLDPANGSQENDTERPLQGQSPWVVNTGCSYSSEELGTDATLLFNMFGRRITQVSTVSDLGNIYEESYPKLDISVSQKVGSVKLKFTVENILDPEIKRTQEVDGKEVTVHTYKKGISASLGCSGTF